LEQIFGQAVLCRSGTGTKTVNQDTPVAQALLIAKAVLPSLIAAQRTGDE